MIREGFKARRAAAASGAKNAHYVNYLSNNTRSRACRAARAWYLGFSQGCVFSSSLCMWGGVKVTAGRECTCERVAEI